MKISALMRKQPLGTEIKLYWKIPKRRKTILKDFTIKIIEKKDYGILFVTYYKDSNGLKNLRTDSDDIFNPPYFLPIVYFCEWKDFDMIFDCVEIIE